MKKQSAALFSNGTDFMRWVAVNCETCWKQSRYNWKTDTYSQFKCSIDKDIQLQASGMTDDDMVNIKTIEATNQAVCPYREDVRIVKRHKPIKNMGGLFD